jgi:hypothetical protein
MHQKTIQTKIEFNQNLSTAKVKAIEQIKIIQQNDLKNNGKKCPLLMELLNIINS